MLAADIVVGAEVQGRGTVAECSSSSRTTELTLTEISAPTVTVLSTGNALPTAVRIGDVNDPGSAVSKLKAEHRDYALLGELNTRPRTTYLAEVKNPNPELAGPAAGGDEHHG